MPVSMHNYATSIHYLNVNNRPGNTEFTSKGPNPGDSPSRKSSISSPMTSFETLGVITFFQSSARFCASLTNFFSIATESYSTANGIQTQHGFEANNTASISLINQSTIHRPPFIVCIMTTFTPKRARAPEMTPVSQLMMNDWVLQEEEAPFS